MYNFLEMYLRIDPPTDLVQRLTQDRNNQVNIIGPERAAVAAYFLAGHFLKEFGPEDVRAFYAMVLNGYYNGVEIQAEQLRLDKKYGNWGYNEPAGVAWVVARSAWFATRDPISSLITILDTTLIYALSTYPEGQKKLAIQALLISQKYFLDQFLMKGMKL